MSIRGHQAQSSIAARTHSVTSAAVIAGVSSSPALATDLSFGQLAAVWRSDFVEGQAGGRALVAASTRAKYLRHLQNHVLPRWCDTLVHEFRAKPVLDWLQEEGQSWYMMADLRNLMSGIFTKAQEWELLPDSFANPMHGSGCRASGKCGRSVS